MATLESLEELLQEEMKDVYDAERQLTKALPKMARKASNPDLKEGFEAHLRQTEQQVGRLEQAFDHLGKPARAKRCEGMKHLISEGEEMLREAGDDATRDALMIAAAQKIEHYEIAAYGTLRTWANLLGNDEVARLFEETLEEEKNQDQQLTEVAEGFVNQAAASGEREAERGGARRMSPGGGSKRRRVSSASPRRHQAAERGRTSRRSR